MIRRISRKRRSRVKVGSRNRRRYTLEQLVRAITAENRHRETDWGKPVGNEVW
jgi:antitoxin MazE